jgi:16S rRNA (adenine1518-N6/adenine1519-N6)-dimethyltransferase
MTTPTTTVTAKPRAKKKFGQHFLEPAWADKVLRAIDPKPDEVFVEIGPGPGALTRRLASRVHAVIAYEIDRDLADALDAEALPNVGVIRGDFLDAQIDLDAEPAGPRSPSVLRVAGNLPYNVASPILFKLRAMYDGGVKFGDATVMLQREVADRLVARPGGKEFGVLSVLMQHAAQVERVLALPPGAFRPPPKVHSALVRLRFHPPDPPVRDAAIFEGLVQAVFTRRRKTLANALLAFPPAVRRLPAAVLRSANLDGTRRPETLTVAEFVRLADALVL